MGNNHLYGYSTFPYNSFLILIYFSFFIIALKIFGTDDDMILDDFREGSLSWLVPTVLGVFAFIFIFAVIDTFVWDEDTEIAGDYISQISDLLDETIYYYRSYAKKGSNVVYGEVYSFIT